MAKVPSDSTVVVVGQGYVGLPLALAAATAGCSVVGIESDPRRAERLNSGQSPTSDVTDAELRDCLDKGSYRSESSFEHVKSAEIVIICVPTPYRDQAPDLSHVTAAAGDVGEYLNAGALIILESTTYPGTTTDVVLPILEQQSGLQAGVDFDLAFSPERIDPGNPEFGVHNTPKIVGGLTPRATERARNFYSRFVEQVVPVSSPAAAEMAKLLENTFRHINIALVNELAILSRDMGIDIWEVIDAAASKPFGFMPFYPGPGVGGHCIPVDPMYLSWRVRQFGGAAKFIELARDINDAMPLYCVSRIQDLLNDLGRPLRGSSVLVVGVAYKSDIADVRESPSIPLITALLQKGASVSFHDPHVRSIELSDGRTMDAVELNDASVRNADCIVIATAHSTIDYDAIAEAGSLIFDTRRVFRSHRPKVHFL